MAEPRKRPRPVAKKKAPVRRGIDPNRPRAKRDWLAEVEGEVFEIEDLRVQKSRIEATIKEKQQRILEAFEHVEQSSKTFTHSDGRRFTVTRVQGSSVVIDEEKLKNRLGASMWNKITARVLDRKKLEAFIGSGEIPTTVVAACSDEVPKAAYVKVTAK